MIDVSEGYINNSKYKEGLEELKDLIGSKYKVEIDIRVDFMYGEKLNEVITIGGEPVFEYHGRYTDGVEWFEVSTENSATLALASVFRELERNV